MRYMKLKHTDNWSKMFYRDMDAYNDSFRLSTKITHEKFKEAYKYQVFIKTDKEQNIKISR